MFVGLGESVCSEVSDQSLFQVPESGQQQFVLDVDVIRPALSRAQEDCRPFGRALLEFGCGGEA